MSGRMAKGVSFHGVSAFVCVGLAAFPGAVKIASAQDVSPCNGQTQCRFAEVHVPGDILVCEEIAPAILDPDGINNEYPYCGYSGPDPGKGCSGYTADIWVDGECQGSVTIHGRCTGLAQWQVGSDVYFNDCVDSDPSDNGTDCICESEVVGIANTPVTYQDCVICTQ